MKKDHVLKDFFSYPMRFADFMNALFFDGHAIIHPCDLHPLDSREIFIGDFLSKERTHDVIMMWERKDFQAILILETQSSVDFTMASRTLLYDALVYNMQDKRFKNHMLMLVMSVVLFHGEGKWNAVTSLLERVKGPEEIKRKQNDWKMRVVDMKEMDENLLKNEDNKKVISGLKTIWRKDEEGLKKMILTKAVARVLATLTGREDILEKNERRWRNSGNVFILERCREIRYGKRKTTREVRFNPATIKENLREAYTRAGNQVRKK